MSQISQDLRNFHPEQHEQPELPARPLRIGEFVLMGIALLLALSYAGQDGYITALMIDAETKELRPSMAYLQHPLRGVDCDATITQRSYSPWTPEKCVKAKVSPAAASLPPRARTSALSPDQFAGDRK